MKNKVEENLDQLARKVIKEASLEEPSFDFTVQMMDKIAVEEIERAIIYKPLISKRTWVIIAILAIVFICFLWNVSFSSEWLSAIKIGDKLSFNLNTVFSKFTMSNVMVYAVGLLSLMLIIQTVVLKNHFNKRML